MGRWGRRLAVLATLATGAGVSYGYYKYQNRLVVHNHTLLRIKTKDLPATEQSKGFFKPT
jgi:hypothetical protein